MATVRQNIERLLACTAQATALKVRVDVLRATLHAEAMRRLEADGAAPTWNARGAGVVRLDGADAPRKARVEDADAFASWVAEHAPDYATAVVELDPADLERALEALTFAGIIARRSRVDVDPSYADALLAGLDLVVDELLEAGSDVPGRELVTAQRVDPNTGEATTVPGIGAHPKAAPRLVVNLDPQAKRNLIADAEAALELELADDRAVAEAQEEDPVTGARHAGTVAEEELEQLAPDHADADDELARARAEAVEESGEDAVREVERTYGVRPASDHRIPYVDDDEARANPVEACRRSAEIDRTEADTYDRGHHRREELLASAVRWEQQADELEEDARAFRAFAGRPVDDVAAPVLSEGPEPVEDTTPRVGGITAADNAALVADGTVTPDEGAIADAIITGQPSAAARDAARRTLAQLIDSDTAWASAKAADLHQLKVTADLGLGKGKVGKAQLREQLVAALATDGS